MIGLGLGLASADSGGGGTSSAYLDGVLSSAVFELDATISASYSGSGTTWSNVISSPADGSAQSAYDFDFGDGVTSTTYPTFNGSAGDPAAYFSFDGGDYFSKGLTQFLKDLHKNEDGDDWTIAATIRTSINSKSHSALCGIIGNSGSAVGIRLGNWTNVVDATRLNLVDTTQQNADVVSPAMTASSNHLLIVSRQKSTNTVKAWHNSATSTFNTTTTDLSGNNDATSTTDTFEIASGGINGNNTVESGWRYYSFAMFNEYFNDTKAAAVISYLETLHSRDYTP